MTLEEAKKILEKEFALISLHKSTEPFEFDESGWIDHEKPSVLESFRVLSKGGYYISISVHDYNMREKRLQKEYEENTKAPGSSENTSENPALEESASQFNDALLDEQSEKIAELTKEKKNLEDQITVLNACKEHNENFDRKQIMRLGKEIARLNKTIRKKNLKIEELRKEGSRFLRGKIKTFGENMDLKVKLKDKDDVIAGLGNELAATKKELEEKTKLVEEVRKYSKEYCEYGIEAVKMIRKMAKAIVGEKPICSEDFKEYRRLANGYSFNPQLPDLSEEEDKKLSPVKDDNSHGDVTNQKDISPSLNVTVRLFGDDVIDLFKNMQHYGSKQ